MQTTKSKAAMDYEYLSTDDYAVIRRDLIKFFLSRHKRFSHLSLKLEKNFLQVNTRSDSETAAVIKIVGDLYKLAQISVGVTKITVVQNNNEVFFVGLDLQSSEIAVPKRTIMATSVLEKTTTTSSARSLDADSLQSLEKICAAAGVDIESIEDYLLSAEANGRKVNLFLVKDEKVIPTKQIQPLLQGFFNWQSASQLQRAMTALSEASIINGTNGTNGKARSAEAKSKSTIGEVKEKQTTSSRSPYKLPGNFKPKSSYQKTLDAVLEHQGIKANELLQKLAAEDSVAIKFIGRLTKNYSKPEAAMKNLLSLAKSKSQELGEPETSNSAD